MTQPGDSVATATTVALDSLAHGWLDAGAEHFFKIELTASTDLWLLSIGETDTSGTLLDSSQNVLAQNDDSKLINNETGFTIRTQRGAGTYYLNVTGDTTDSSGPYTLSVRAVTDPGDTAATAKPLSLRLPDGGTPQLHQRRGLLQPGPVGSDLCGPRRCGPTTAARRSRPPSSTIRTSTRTSTPLPNPCGP